MHYIRTSYCNYYLLFFSSKLTRLNLEAQRTEQELRDELTTCVTKAASDVDKRRIVELERSETTLRLESEKLKVGVEARKIRGVQF